MKKAQWITAVTGLLLVILLFVFGKTVPDRKAKPSAEHTAGDGHEHDPIAPGISTDSILNLAKKQLSPSQVVRLDMMEKQVTVQNGSMSGQEKEKNIHLLHQLARFWADSARIFEPYAWYLGEASRLENSEKTLTFAARLFLENLQDDDVTERRLWKALQAKDLFERSLLINPANDSARIGLGACYLFGGISSTPMEGIMKIREVVEKDSTNVYGQMMLAKGSLISGQYDKAVSRLETINRVKPGELDVLLLLAEISERLGEKNKAAGWYQKALPFVKQADLKKAIEQRIGDLRK